VYVYLIYPFVPGYRQVTTQHLHVSKEHGGESQEECDVAPVEYDPQWPIVIAKLKK
jgi:hypothetical protein